MLRFLTTIKINNKKRSRRLRKRDIAGIKILQEIKRPTSKLSYMRRQKGHTIHQDHQNVLVRRHQHHLEIRPGLIVEVVTELDLLVATGKKGPQCNTGQLVAHLTSRSQDISIITAISNLIVTSKGAWPIEGHRDVQQDIVAQGKNRQAASEGSA